MRILRYAARFASGKLLAAALAGLVGGALSAGTVAIIGGALEAGRSTRWQVLAFAAMTVVGAVLRYLSTDLLTRFSQRQLMDMARDLSARVVASGLRDVEEVGSSRLLAALIDDLVIITNAIAALPVVITNAAIFAACFLYVAWLSPQVWAIGTVTLAIALVTYLWIAGRATARSRLARGHHDRLIGHYRALTDGFTELKLHQPRRAAFLTRLLGSTFERMTDLNVTALAMFNAANNYYQVTFLALVGVLVFGATSWTGATMSTVTSAILALLYGRAPLETLVGWVPIISRAQIAFDRYEAILAELPREESDERTALPMAPCSRIELRGVTYQYTGAEREGFGIGPIDLTIRAGEILFITGGNGSGKSTLAKVLAGLYLPSSGELRVDGDPITTANRDRYRQLVSSVFTSFHLFPELFGLERPSLDAEAGEWLRRMRLDERIQVRNGAFSDLNLSTGQRKRVALMVALLEDRPVCILDEWAADQDVEYRDEFYTAILPELKARNKVVIVVSHDDRFYALGDRVIKLERGVIVADRPASESAMGTLPPPLLARA